MCKKRTFKEEGYACIKKTAKWEKMKNCPVDYVLRVSEIHIQSE